MRHFALQPVYWLAVALSAFAGCKSHPASGCISDSTCPSGQVCLNTACEQLCANDKDCSLGAKCDGGLCRQPPQDVPHIEAVRGDGSSACSDAFGGHCFNDHLVIDGQNLQNTTFRLDGTSTYELTVASADAQSATITLPSDLSAGSFTLVAQNAAGSDTTGVNILQGEPGPDATGSELVVRLNSTSTVGRLVVDRMPVADLLIQHLNSGSGAYKLKAAILAGSGAGTGSGNDIVDAINDEATSRLIDASHVQLPSGNALVGVLNSATSLIGSSHVQPPDGVSLISSINGATSGTIAANRLQLPSGNALITQINGANSGTIAVDRLPVHRLYKEDTVADATTTPVSFAEIVPLCGDSDGCTMRLGYTYYDFDGSGTAYGATPATVWGPSCEVSINADGSWAVSPACVQNYWVAPGLYNFVYGSGNADRDGDGKAMVVLLFYTSGGIGCTLAESPTVDGTDALGPDVQDQSFYLWTDARATGAYFSNPNRACRLVVED